MCPIYMYSPVMWLMLLLHCIYCAANTARRYSIMYTAIQVLAECRVPVYTMYAPPVMTQIGAVFVWGCNVIHLVCPLTFLWWSVLGEPW